MKRGIFTLLLLACFLLAKAQLDSLVTNQYDEKGKKHGYWIVHVDTLFKETTVDKSSFAHYAYFQHGKRVWRSYHAFLKPCHIQMHDNPVERGALNLLNGKIVFTYPNHHRPSRRLYKNWAVYKDGFLQQEWISYDTTDYAYEYFDHTKKYNEQEASYHMRWQLYKNNYKEGYVYYEGRKLKTIIEKKPVIGPSIKAP